MTTPQEQAFQQDLQFQQAIKTAQELRQLYKEAKRLKENLEAEKVVLDYRRREVQNLNVFLRHQLDECLRIHEAYYTLLQELQLLLRDRLVDNELRTQLSQLVREQAEAYPASGIG